MEEQKRESRQINEPFEFNLHLPEDFRLFVKKGPQRIRQDLQRTQCRLMLVVDLDSDQQYIQRFGEDVFPYDYSLSDLPELIEDTQRLE